MNPDRTFVSSRGRFPMMGRRLCSSLIAVSACAFASFVFAQPAAPGGDEGQRRRGGRGGGAQDGQGGFGGRGQFNQEDVQARLMTTLRERFEVTDDEEWKIISDRITQLMELRRTATPMGGGGLAALGFGGRGGDAGGRGGRAARGGNNPELAALQDAVRDKLPDAEIKSRLERLRDVRRNEEARLLKAQEELRAVLTVRQEAAAVVAGLLP